MTEPAHIWTIVLIRGALRGMAVQGTCDPRYAEVAEEFERNFAERGEIGASVCVIVEGETVVDMWGGTANPAPAPVPAADPAARAAVGSSWERDSPSDTR
jgi:hypothetical protein